jgi:hypothetical protein
MRRNFSFIYPLMDARVDLDRQGGWRYDHVTNLIIKGIAFKQGGSSLDSIEDRYEFDIEEILYEGKNVYPMLEAFKSLDDIEAACFHHIHHLFTDQESEYEIPYQANDVTAAKVITLPMKRKIK